MRKSTVFILHLLFWFLIGILLYTIVAPILAMNDVTHGEAIRKVQSILPVVVALIFSIFYTVYFSVPFFVKNKKRLFYLVGFIVLLMVVYAFKGRYINNNSAYLVDTIGIFTPFLILGFVAFLFRSLIILWKDKLAKAQLEKEQMFTQLELLKAKIDPHFLFNSLNNIDVLIEENPRVASDYLNRLSDILRYVLYETREEDILLSKELDQIRSYMELQKIRTSNPTFAELVVRGEVNDGKIAPMIFIPFIENAFKHCKNKSVENAIRIEFVIDPEQVLMTCRNYYDVSNRIPEKKEGLGIEIIKQRLHLLYPGSHELVIDDSALWFTVILGIKLKNGN